jgi:putative peptide zinc metalloprotease protein
MAFVWRYTAPGELINQLAYNAMLIASVSTIIFNANPLLRYDGYYILSDWLQIPNLRQRSVDYSMGLIKRHIFRVKASEPLPPPMQRVWLLSYAICSSIYRVFIGIMIIVLVAFKVPILGMLMAIGGIATWAVVPVVKVGKYLLIEPELHRKRGRAMAFCGAVAAAVIILVGLIRFPVHVDANGIVEPGTKRVLTAGWGGFIRNIRVTDGQQVQQGQVLMVLANPELDSAIVQKQAELKSWQARLMQATMEDPAARTVYEPSYMAVKQQLDELMRRKGLLTITAPIAGRVVQPKLHYMAGLFLHQGEEVLTLARTQDLLIRANVDQKDAGLVAQYHPTEAEVRLAGYLWDAPVMGHDLKFIDAAQEKLAHPSLGQAGGGDVQVDPRDPSGEKPMVQQFELRVRIDNPDGKLLPGQRSYVRCTLTNKPLIWQWTNRFWQLLMAENNGKWL